MTSESIKPKLKDGRGMAIGLMLLGLVLGACDMSARSDRVRITATVDVNGVLYSGSAVQQYNCRDGGGIWGSMDVGGCTVKGEAVVVDLKERGYLFLIFKGPHGDVSSLGRAMLHAENRNGGDHWTLLPNEMPVMVTFKDINNPKSVVQVDPEHLDATFGKGVNLKQVEVKYANFSSITKGEVKKALPWADVHNNPFDIEGVNLSDGTKGRLDIYYITGGE